jgi:hypothetical protein
MSYAQIDVSAPRHRKVWSLTDPAFRLWVSGLCYCQEHLTDGVLHRTVVASLTPRLRSSHIDELVSAGLWEADPTNGWRVHEYLTWNSSRSQVEAQRAKIRERQERWRQKKQAQGDAVTNASQDRHGDALVTRPIRYDTIRTDTIRSTEREAPAAPVARPPDAPALMGRRNEHARHAMCGRPCVPEGIYRDMVEARSGDGAYVTAYVHRVQDAMRDEPVPLDTFKFWRTRWDSDHQPARPAGRQVKATPPGSGWTCPHRPPCDRRWTCERLAQIAALEEA